MKKLNIIKMKKIIEVPDKEIKLSHGDSVRIYANKKGLEFYFFCDVTVNIFILTKQELLDLLK